MESRVLYTVPFADRRLGNGGVAIQKDTKEGLNLTHEVIPAIAKKFSSHGALSHGYHCQSARHYCLLMAMSGILLSNIYTNYHFHGNM